MEALSLNLAERRVACDGEAYTFKEYVDFYGFNALSRWQTSSAEQPVGTIVGQSESKRKGPVGTGDSPCPGMTPNDPQGPTAARQGHPSMTIINNKKHRSELDRCSCKIAQPLLDRMIPGEELRRCFECVKPVGPPVEPVERPTGPQDTETAEPAKQEQHVKTQTAEPVKQEQLANVKTETAEPVKQEQVRRQWKAGDLRMNGPAGNLEIAEHAYVEGCCWFQSFCQNNCNTRRLINKRNYTLPQEVIILSK